MILHRYLPSKCLDSLLSKQILGISRISDFNDPFESYQQLAPWTGNLLGKVTEYFRNEKCPLSEKESKLLSSLSGNDYVEKKNELAEEWAHKILRKLETDHAYVLERKDSQADKSYRVVCFTESGLRKEDELLLWSHYSEKHSGFRMWLDAAKDPIIGDSWGKVKYKKEVPSVPAFDFAICEPSLQTIARVALSKCICWKYEHEVRCLIPCWRSTPKKPGCSDGHTLDYITIDPNAIIRIDFGLRFDLDAMRRVIKSTKRRKRTRHVRFFKTSMGRSRYELEYEEIVH